MNLEDKKLATVRQNRIWTDKEVQLKMSKREKAFAKENHKVMLNTW